MISSGFYCTIGGRGGDGREDDETWSNLACRIDRCTNPKFMRLPPLRQFSPHYFFFVFRFVFFIHTYCVSARECRDNHNRFRAMHVSFQLHNEFIQWVMVFAQTCTMMMYRHVHWLCAIGGKKNNWILQEKNGRDEKLNIVTKCRIIESNRSDEIDLCDSFLCLWVPFFLKSVII